MFFQDSKKITCLAKQPMSSLKESDEQISPPDTPGSLGVLVANSHFSKTRARRGKSGCLQKRYHMSIRLDSNGVLNFHLSELLIGPQFFEIILTDNPLVQDFHPSLHVLKTEYRWFL